MRRFLLVVMLITGMTLTSSPVQAICTIFEHRDFGGASWWLDHRDRMKMVEGDETICSVNEPGCIFFEPSWNDAVSSFTVDPGCTITLWEHVNQDGAYFRTWRSYSYVGSNWNDEASEALCTCP